MTKKVNTWAIAEDIEEHMKSSHGSIFEDTDFSYDSVDGTEDDDAELEITISGDIEHPMSGYGDSYNTAIDVDGVGFIKPDGTITIKGTYKMEVGTATYIDELDELRKISSTAKVGKEKSFDWEASDAEDFVEGLAEIPQ